MRQPNNKKGPEGMAKVNKDVVKRLMSYIGHYKLRFAAVLVCIVVNALAMVSCSLYLQTLIDSYITPLLQAAAPDFAPLFRSVLIMGCIYAVGILACLFYNRTMVSIAQGTLKRIRDEMFEHMQTLPIRYFDTHTHGDIMSHYTNDTDTLRQMLAQSIPQMFSSLITIISVFFAMLFTSWQLTIFVLCFVFIMLQVTGRVAGKSGYYFIRQQKALGDVNGYIEEMINGQKVIKVFCHEEKAKEIFDQKNEELCKDASAANSFANILMPIMGNLGNLQYVLLATIGGTMALGGVGGMTIGTIASFLQLSRSFMNPISQISNQLNMVVMALAGAERIFRLMDEEPEVDEGYVTLVNAKYDKNGELTESKERTGMWAWKHPHGDGTLTYTKMRGEVRFYDVDFGYNENKIVLHNISLYAEPGQKVAFVGSTGAGKSTIMNLLCRFYDTTSGEVLVDGVNVRDMDLYNLRDNIGMAMQDVFLFSDTIEGNIAYGRPNCSFEEVKQAAIMADANHFIQALSDGYDTIVGERGVGLSGGQKQRISLARALLKDPSILILDDTTSAVDMETESYIQSQLKKLDNKCTIFVIAYRISSIRDADLILVMDNGRIIEQGTHEQLVAAGGYYATAFHNQYGEIPQEILNGKGEK